ncbi:unnamed protein product [Trichogramma brassicae]|uniref:Uncharacterized protein n=1 Tax=Trichogramma brassicae TaxID=86971 RepID=A0A6H5IN21_9HYME|nr:unnamed protein product [Trichogramma brassicae]
MLHLEVEPSLRISDQLGADQDSRCAIVQAVSRPQERKLSPPILEALLSVERANQSRYRLSTGASLRCSTLPRLASSSSLRTSSSSLCMSSRSRRSMSISRRDTLSIFSSPSPTSRSSSDASNQDPVGSASCKRLINSFFVSDVGKALLFSFAFSCTTSWKYFTKPYKISQKVREYSQCNKSFAALKVRML